MSGRRIYEGRELLEEIIGGNRHAFTMLFESSHAKLYTFALKLTRSQVLAEEIIQDVFLNLWLHRATLGNIENLDAYLNRITRNLSFNALRNVARHKVLVNDFGDDENYPDHSTEQSLEYKDTEGLIQQAITRLSGQQQQVYQLCHREGLTYEQAAQRLSIAPSTVHSHMKAALRNIRIYFKKMGIPMVIIALIIP